MKKYFIFTALAAVALAACTKIETNEPVVNVDEPVLFSAYSGRAATKAKPIGTVAELAAQGGFGVFAYYTANDNFSNSAKPNFMWNQAVTSSDDGNNWTYTPIKYWPNNDSNTANNSATWVDHVSFFAYAPVVTATDKTTGATANTVGITAVTGNDTAGDPKVTYVVAEDPSQSVDFLYNNTAHLDMTKQGVGAKVDFNFQHALTRLGIIVQGVFDKTSAPSADDVDGNTKIYIESLNITTTANIAKKGVFNLNTKTWGSKEGTATLAIGSNIPDELKSPNDGVTKEETSLIKKDANNNDQYFMFIPDAAAQEYNFNIVYKVITTDENLSTGSSEITNNITKKASIKFEAGKAYTIKLELGMTTVKMSASVQNWNDADPQPDPIWLPINQ